MKGNLDWSFKGQDFLLHPDKIIYWKNTSSLILTDLHIGKAGHFRKSGIAVPGNIQSADLDRLDGLMQEFKPKRLLILGDLFHSDYNREMLLFKEHRAKHKDCAYILVEGNHDIIENEDIFALGIDEIYESYEEGPFYFSHHPTEHKELYNLCGHVHPGIRLRGKAFQSLRIPMFYFGEKIGILPAFSSFSGLGTVKPKKKDFLFGICDGEVIKLR